MPRHRSIIACAGALLCAACAATPARQLDTPVPAERPAPVTAPGAPATAEAPLTETPAPKPPPRQWYQADPDAYRVDSAVRTLSLYKPMFLLPYTYSPAYQGADTELMFQLSFKLRLFGTGLYVAYSQKSFWEAYNARQSSPFKETDYNPEVFYRFLPADRERWWHLGVDLGAEHESNGQGLPNSRSWNRVYIAPFQDEDHHSIYWKWWYRIPENDNIPATSPERDDNPHIGAYYGYSELTYEQQLFGKQLARLMVRYNPVTGRGAFNLEYTVPDRDHDPDFFWTLYIWQGYGESLIDYNRSIFRIGVGLALAR